MWINIAHNESKVKVICFVSSSVALEQSVLRKLLKAIRTEMSVKCLSVFSKFRLFFEMFRN